QEKVARQARASWKPETPLSDEPMSCWTKPYGLETVADLFTDRQLVALTTLSDLIAEVHDRVVRDTAAANFEVDSRPLADGGIGPEAYADAMAVYLALAVDRASDYGSAVCSWHNGPKMEAIRNTFSRQVIPMTWDYAEGNPFSDSSGNWL